MKVTYRLSANAQVNAQVHVSSRREEEKKFHITIPASCVITPYKQESVTVQSNLPSSEHTE